MMNKYFRTLRPILFALAALLMTLPAEGQNRRRTAKEERARLESTIDSLYREIARLQMSLSSRDSLAAEIAEILEENDEKVAPEHLDHYSAEATDSLLSIWYLHTQLQEDDDEGPIEMDSVRLASSVPDSVLIARLEKMNSFITLPFNETVRNYIVLYSEKMPSRMSKLLSLCQYYMPIFEETFNKYGLPDELKYMAIIESALNPTAVSRAGAKGMWQFMLRSAKLYGLEIDTYVDERLDPFKSADAAARYLADSYKLFGDWNLAISSYNCGPGNVNKAIRRCGGKRDFWSVYEFLPRETRGYMPAFVGAMYAIHYSKELGLTAGAPQMPAQVDTFEIRRNLHFGQIHELVGVPVEELENLNPQYIRDIIPGNAKPYILRIPYTYTGDFIAHEDSVYTYRTDSFFRPQTLVREEAPRATRGTSTASSTLTYKVKSGDTLGKIASRYHVSVKQLKQWNNLRSDVVRVGQRLTIHGASSGASVAPSTHPSTGSSGTSAPASSASGKTYTVQKGDTLSAIAKKNGVSVKALMDANGLKSSTIRVGMKLRIP